jgi:hypothetical protein
LSNFAGEDNFVGSSPSAICTANSVYAEKMQSSDSNDTDVEE